MELLVCKACGSSAIIPMDVEVRDVDLDTGEFTESDVDEEDEELGEAPGLESDVDVDAADLTGDEVDQESRFYSCHVCGDNWLAVKEREPEGSCLVTFIHQMGMAPVLKRIAHMQTHIVISDSTVDNWEYYIGDKRIDESVWLEKLSSRRKVLKSVCSN